MASINVPTYFEVRLPDGSTAFRHLDDVLQDATLRGEVVASLLKHAEVLELQAAEQRGVAQALKRLADERSGGAE